MHDDFQGRGVGKALMQALLDLADSWTPYTRLELTVYADNARAIALYKQFGFDEEGVLQGATRCATARTSIRSRWRGSGPSRTQPL